jgi:hypothetical protein
VADFGVGSARCTAHEYQQKDRLDEKSRAHDALLVERMNSVVWMGFSAELRGW